MGPTEPGLPMGPPPFLAFACPCPQGHACCPGLVVPRCPPSCFAPGWGSKMGPGRQALPDGAVESPQDPHRALTVPFSHQECRGEWSSQNYLHRAISVYLTKQTKCLKHFLVLSSSPVLWTKRLFTMTLLSLTSEHPLGTHFKMLQELDFVCREKTYQALSVRDWFSLFLFSSGLCLNYP